MSPSSKVRVTAIVGAVVAGVLGVITTIWPDVNIPEPVVGFVVTAIVTALAYVWPESNPSPSAVEAVRRMS